jgi:lysophospholipase L1-like esterase
MRNWIQPSVRQLSAWLPAGVVIPLACAFAAETNAPPHARWEKDITAFEAADRTNPPPKNAVVFVGSSSIRLWKAAPEQFPKHRIINRGFGGSQMADSVAFAERIVISYHPRLVVIYAGDNDIALGKTPERVCDDFKAFVAKVHGALPDTRIAYLAIKPSSSRLKLFEKHKATNELIREFIAGDRQLVYVDTWTPILGPDGKPRDEFFMKDQLHLNAEGYKQWAGIVGPVLDKFDPPNLESR